MPAGGGTEASDDAEDAAPKPTLCAFGPRDATVRAERVAYLIDGEAYFRALAAALVRARRTLYIAGWDIDARARLPDPTRRGRPVTLRKFLDRLARRRPQLQIHLLGWDFAPLFTFERLPFPALHLGWRTHERVHFVADGAHPSGASHHQKLVIIDDRVAFSGGLDLAVKRWDTPAHAPRDRRRVDPLGLVYEPFHDVQIAVSGQAARALGDVFRERWRRATGDELGSSDGGRHDPWPQSLVPDARDADVSIACTAPEWEGYEAVRDVSVTIAKAILGAERWIYIENQYVSCDAIAALLARRLDEPDGPEVVVVAPRCCSGWLEERTMGVLRGCFFEKVRSAKYAKDRFRMVCPEVGGTAVYVHAKVMVIDDQLARIGSANLSERSMALDTECDVSLHAGSDGRHAVAVGALRNRLLAEHLGTTEEAIDRELGACGSIVRLVDTLGDAIRGLRPLEDPIPSEGDITWLRTVADPERPIEAARLVHVFGRYMKQPNVASRFAVGVAAAAMMMMLVILAAWAGQ